MIKVVVVEDDQEQLLLYRKVIINILQKVKFSIEFTYAGSDVDAVLKIANNAHESDEFIFLLDIELPNQKMTGVELAQQIRRLRNGDSIVFATSHTEKALEIIQKNIAPDDYIVKTPKVNEMSQMVSQILINVIRRQINISTGSEFMLTLKIGDSIQKLPFKDVDYIQATGQPHFLEVVGKNMVLEFRGELRDIADKYPQLVRSHKSILVNPGNIKELKKRERKIIFWDNNACDVSFRNVNIIKDLII